MYPLIVELELWLPAGSPLAPLEGKEVAARCQRETGLAPDVVLGLNFASDEQDVHELERDLAGGAVRLEGFRGFCRLRGISTDALDARSAAEFLVFAKGQPLAWLHLPAESHGLAMAKSLTKWARENNMQLRDGGNTNDLLSEAQVYALWQSAA